MRLIYLASAFILGAPACAQNHARPSDCELIIRNAKEIIREFDRDSDGRLSLAEQHPIIARLDAMAQKTSRETGSTIDTGMADEMKARDLNQDGFLELNEIAVVPRGNPPVSASCI